MVEDFGLVDTTHTEGGGAGGGPMLCPPDIRPEHQASQAERSADLWTGSSPLGTHRNVR